MMTDEPYGAAARDLTGGLKLEDISPHDANGVVGCYVAQRLVDGAADWNDAATGSGRSLTNSAAIWLSSGGATEDRAKRKVWKTRGVGNA